MCGQHRVVRYGHEGLAADLIRVMGGGGANSDRGRQKGTVDAG